MKYALLFLLLPAWAYAQAPLSMECDYKLNEFALWEPVSAFIEITPKTITVEEVKGIRLVIEYSDVKKQEGAWYYATSNAVRAVVPINNNNIITVLNKNYKCRSVNRTLD